jgi:hypothetical protein
LDRRLGGPHSRSGRRGEEKILDPTGTGKVANRYTDCTIPAIRATLKSSSVFIQNVVSHAKTEHEMCQNYGPLGYDLQCSLVDRCRFGGIFCLFLQSKRKMIWIRERLDWDRGYDQTNLKQ